MQAAKQFVFFAEHVGVCCFQIHINMMVLMVAQQRRGTGTTIIFKIYLCVLLLFSLLQGKASARQAAFSEKHSLILTHKGKTIFKLRLDPDFLCTRPPTAPLEMLQCHWMKKHHSGSECKILREDCVKVDQTCSKMVIINGSVTMPDSCFLPKPASAPCKESHLKCGTPIPLEHCPSYSLNYMLEAGPLVFCILCLGMMFVIFYKHLKYLAQRMQHEPDIRRRLLNEEEDSDEDDDDDDDDDDAQRNENMLKSPLSVWKILKLTTGLKWLKCCYKKDGPTEVFQDENPHPHHRLDSEDEDNAENENNRNAAQDARQLSSTGSSNLLNWTSPNADLAAAGSGLLDGSREGQLNHAYQSDSPIIKRGSSYQTMRGNNKKKKNVGFTQVALNDGSGSGGASACRNDEDDDDDDDERNGANQKVFFEKTTATHNQKKIWF